MGGDIGIRLYKGRGARTLPRQFRNETVVKPEDPTYASHWECASPAELTYTQTLPDLPEVPVR